MKANTTTVTTIRVQEGTTSEVASNIHTSHYVLYSQIYKQTAETYHIKYHFQHFGIQIQQLSHIFFYFSGTVTSSTRINFATRQLLFVNIALNLS
jgi:hypothetical protein